MPSTDTPMTDAQIERGNTLVSAGQRIAEWRDLCLKLERDRAELEKALREVVELSEFGTTGPETKPPCKSRALTEQQATSMRGAVSAIARAALKAAKGEA